MQDKLELSHDDQLSELKKLTTAKSFLGREFLTWLWWLSESPEKSFTIKPSSGGTTYEGELWIEDRIKLQSLVSKNHENAIRGGDPSRSAEAAAALSDGKLAKELKVGIHIKGYGDFITSLTASDLDPRSLQLPSIDDIEDVSLEVENIAAIRMEQVTVFYQVLDGLFLMFLSERTDPSWDKSGLAKLKKWIKERKIAGPEGTLH